ncbi:MAG: hypothetical protein JWL91_826 [Sphingomonas bacterium]|nr:hypothetical protein [Sphingomonas bacterium]MDB5688950.1 hypothetical protein [Sphingomonas bacterium]
MASEPPFPDSPNGPVDVPVPEPMDPIPATPTDPIVGGGEGIGNIGNYPSMAAPPLLEGV